MYLLQYVDAHAPINKWIFGLYTYNHTSQKCLRKVTYIYILDLHTYYVFTTYPMA